MSLFRPFSLFWALSLVLATFLGGSASSSASDITVIEEDWQLEIGIPNPERSAPQVNSLISSLGDTSGYYAVLLVNQHGNEGGGLQLQLWNGPTLLATREEGLASLATEGEKIQWTTRMEIDSRGILTVQVYNGTSDTWGKFGGKGSLTISVTTPLSNLNAYDPNVSTANTGIDFGNNRVTKMTLRKVRVYYGNKKTVEQALERVVFQN